MNGGTAAAGGGSDDNNNNPSSNEARKKLEAMGKIEKEFTDLKEKFFNDKMAQLKKEIDTIKNGTSLPAPSPPLPP